MSEGTTAVLKKLYQLDLEMAEIYSRLVRSLNNELSNDSDNERDDEQRTALKQHLHDHRRHSQDLALVLRDLGSTESELRTDSERHAPAAGADFTASLLASLHEHLHERELALNLAYEGALRAPLPVDVLSLIQKNYADEQRHIAFIERHLHGSVPQAG